MLQQTEYNAASGEYHRTAEEYSPLPEEHAPLPEEFAAADPFRHVDREYNQTAEAFPAEPHPRKRKKMLRYILGSIAIAAVVLTAAVESGQMSWSDIFPGTRLTADYLYPSYAYTVEAGNNYRVSFDETQTDALLEYLAGTIEALCNTLSQEQVDQAVRTQNFDLLHFAKAPEGNPEACTSIIWSTYTPEEGELFGVDPFTPHYGKTWTSEEIRAGTNGITVFWNLTAKEYGTASAQTYFFSSIRLLREYESTGEESLARFAELYRWGKGKSYAEILAFLRDNAASVLEQLNDHDTYDTFTVLAGSAEFHFPLFYKIEISEETDTYPHYTYPCYIAAVREGNTYRVSYDSSKNEAYYGYLADFIYTMCQSFSEEDVAAASKLRWDEFLQFATAPEAFSIAFDSLHEDVSASDDHDYITVDPFTLRFGKTWTTQELQSGEHAITVQDANGVHVYGIYGQDSPHFIHLIDLSEDRSCFGDVPLVYVIDLYNWAKDMSREEIVTYLRDHSTLNAQQTYTSTDRTVEFTVLQGSTEIYLPEFLKIEVIEP